VHNLVVLHLSRREAFMLRFWLVSLYRNTTLSETRRELGALLNVVGSQYRAGKPRRGRSWRSR
jgi:hypothetical protein